MYVFSLFKIDFKLTTWVVLWGITYNVFICDITWQYISIAWRFTFEDHYDEEVLTNQIDETFNPQKSQICKMKELYKIISLSKLISMYEQAMYLVDWRRFHYMHQ